MWVSLKGRYRTSSRQGSGQRFWGHDGIGFLRLQNLVQLTSALSAAAKPNGCLMSLSGRSPSEGQRPEPLHCCRPPLIVEGQRYAGGCCTGSTPITSTNFEAGRPPVCQYPELHRRELPDSPAARRQGSGLEPEVSAYGFVLRIKVQFRFKAKTVLDWYRKPEIAHKLAVL